jgi:von Willebrand factor type A domain
MPDGSFIKGVQSPSHPIAVSMGTVSTASSADPSMSKASATLSLGSAALEKDFILIVLSKDVGIPKAILETHPTIRNHRALMATLVPKFSLPPSRPEIVFVADRSGSMGANMGVLISAMKVFLKSMPVGVKFNICSFGSGHSFLWPKSQSYSQETLNLASTHLLNFRADFGGTETYAAIKATIENRYPDIPLEIILLTDGDIWQQEELFKYVNAKVGETNGNIRIFTLGIGNGVSHALIEGLARAGNGFSQAVQIGERLDNCVVRMLRGALSPHITDYTLEVKYEKENDDFELIDKVTEGMKVLLSEDDKDKEKTEKPTISLFDTNLDPEKEDLKVNDSSTFWLPDIPFPKLHQAPHKIPTLFAFSRTSVYLLMSPETIQRNPTAVILRATSAHGPLCLEIPIEHLALPAETIHQLAAKKAVQDLEEGRGWIYDAKDQNGVLIKDRYPSCFDDLVKREAVRLGEKFQIAGKWCSFVAVAANDKEIAEKEDRMTEQKSLVVDADGDILEGEFPSPARQLRHRLRVKDADCMRVEVDASDLYDADAADDFGFEMVGGSPSTVPATQPVIPQSFPAQPRTRSMRQSVPATPHSMGSQAAPTPSHPPYSGSSGPQPLAQVHLFQQQQRLAANKVQPMSVGTSSLSSNEKFKLPMPGGVTLPPSLAQFYAQHHQINPMQMQQQKAMGQQAGPVANNSASPPSALQEYQMQHMLLEQQNKKRLMMARQEQDNVDQGQGWATGEMLALKEKSLKQLPQQQAQHSEPTDIAQRQRQLAAQQQPRLLQQNKMMGLGGPPLRMQMQQTGLSSQAKPQPYFGSAAGPPRAPYAGYAQGEFSGPPPPPPSPPPAPASQSGSMPLPAEHQQLMLRGPVNKLNQGLPAGYQQAMLQRSSRSSPPPPPPPPASAAPSGSPAKPSSPLGRASLTRKRVSGLPLADTTGFATLSAETGLSPAPAREQAPPSIGTGPSNLFGGITAGAEMVAELDYSLDSSPGTLEGGDVDMMAMEESTLIPAKQGRMKQFFQRQVPAPKARRRSGSGSPEPASSKSKKKGKKGKKETFVDSSDFSAPKQALPVTDWTSRSLADKVARLIELQTFEGSWPTEEREAHEIARIVFERVAGGMEWKEGVEKAVWITLLVVKWLEIFAVEEEGVWSMVVEKARGWLEGQGEMGLESWETEAEGLVKTFGGMA